MKLALGAAAIAASLALAGCGGGSKSSATAAGVIPDDVSAVFSVSTNIDSAGWKKAEALLNRFPGKSKLLASLTKSLRKKGLDYRRDVEPALGDHADVVLLDLSSTGDNALLVVKPTDQKKLDALLAKQSQSLQREVIGGWTVLAPKAQLDRFDQLRKNAGSLDSSSGFKDAMDGLPADSIATMYIRGSDIQSRIDRSIQRRIPGGFSTQTIGAVAGLGLAVTPQSSGLRLDAALAAQLKGHPSTYHSAVAGSIPAGAVFYLSFHDLAGPLLTIVSNLERTSPSFAQQEAQLESVLGFSIKKDLVALTAGEGAIALYPSPGGATPGFVAAFDEADPSHARAAIGKLNALAQLGRQAKTKPIKVGRATGTAFTFSSGTTIDAFVSGSTLFLSNTLAPFHTGGVRSLAQDPVYAQAVAASGLPAQTTGFVYVNMRDGLRYLFDYEQRKGTKVPAAVKDNLAPLRGLILYSTSSSKGLQLSGFVGIK